MKSNIRKNSEPKPLSKGFSEENDRKNQAPMPNEDDMSECPTLSPFYSLRHRTAHDGDPANRNRSGLRRFEADDSVIPGRKPDETPGTCRKNDNRDKPCRIAGRLLSDNLHRKDCYGLPTANPPTPERCRPKPPEREPRAPYPDTSDRVCGYSRSCNSRDKAGSGDRSSP